MNHTKITKYIKSQFKNMVEDKIKHRERYIHIYLNKLIKNQYILKNPVLREYCITDSITEFNRQISAENNKCIKEHEESVLYRLT